MKVENWNGYDIRFVDHNGEWWAVMVDLATALNLRADKIRERLDNDYLNRVPISDDLGRVQDTYIVHELGVYDAIIRSRKPEARAFKDWVFNVIKHLREQSGLEGFEVFKTMDTEFQKTCMDRLHDGLPVPTRGDYCKANMITNKAVANVFEFDIAVKKDDMTPPMLKLRHEILPYTVDLIVAKERFGLDISVSDNVYNKAYKIFNNMEE